ncbi:hypothetical protein B0H13DRAFT_1894780 [Mycena leptocephala]|nr:hypothetical protein B0H13DRAFT_1894780 [Mycena leptocephala]
MHKPCLLDHFYLATMKTSRSVFIDPLPPYPGFLANSKALEVLGVSFTNDDDRATFEHCGHFCDDPRSITMVQGDLLEDWESGATGGDDYGSRPERFIQKRHSGEIKGWTPRITLRRTSHFFLSTPRWIPPVSAQQKL